MWVTTAGVRLPRNVRKMVTAFHTTRRVVIVTMYTFLSVHYAVNIEIVQMCFINIYIYSYIYIYRPHAMDTAVENAHPLHMLVVGSCMCRFVERCKICVKSLVIRLFKKSIYFRRYQQSSQL